MQWTARMEAEVRGDIVEVAKPQIALGECSTHIACFVPEAMDVGAPGSPAAGGGAAFWMPWTRASAHNMSSIAQPAKQWTRMQWSP